MQLNQYLMSLGRVLWIVLVIPVLVGAITATLLIRSAHPQFAASVNVQLPVNSTQPASTDQMAADFSAAAGLPRVLGAAAAAASAKDAGAVGAVAVQRVDTDSSFVTVTYTADTPAHARAAARVVADLALRKLLQPQIAAAQRSYQALADHRQALQDQAQTLKQRSSAAGLSPDAVLVRQESLAIQQASTAQLQVVTLQSEMAAARHVITTAPAPVAAVTPTLGVLRRSLLNAGAALFLLVAVLLCVELARGPEMVSRLPKSSNGKKVSAFDSRGFVALKGRSSSSSRTGKQTPASARRRTVTTRS
jgi:hypothetical protein